MSKSSSIPDRIAAAAQAFVGTDPGRSIAVVCNAPLTCGATLRHKAPRPAASIMKLPLAMALFDKARSGSVDLTEKLPVSRFGRTRYVSILAGFDAAHELSLSEVTCLALITSDNPLTVALQDYVSFEEVNAFMRGLGLGPENVMAAGFGEAELGPANRANRLTAEACLKLFDEVRGNPLYAPLHRALANNLRNMRIPARLPESAVVAHKTGSLDGVINDAGIVTDADIDFMLVCLTENQPDPEATTRDIAVCAEAIYAALKGA